MKTLTVDLPGRSYDIQIQRGLLDAAGERCRAAVPRATRIFLVTDTNVAPLYGDRVIKSLEGAGYRVARRVIPAGEPSKSAQMLAALWEDMMDFGLTRTDAVIALGGGVVGDLTGFAAATILRGVDFIQIPTTLLAQVDSSVGGKVAVDLEAGKNLAGAFWQPRLVLMDPDVLKSLDDRIFSDGMAEVVKYGCIRDRAFFEALERRPSRAALMAEIENILYTCCEIKRGVVVSDERDTGERMLLNFGHTLGHAYEKAGRYETWTHGQAVAAGMIKISRLGEALRATPAGTADRIAALLSALDLPVEIPCTGAQYASAVGLDKKGAGAGITLILLERLGKAVPYHIPKADLLEMLK